MIEVLMGRSVAAAAVVVASLWGLAHAQPQFHHQPLQWKFVDVAVKHVVVERWSLWSCDCGSQYLQWTVAAAG
uniref:Putative secreted protein n=1 Tax=Anopheles triannulatus TaxID=58253 RepID=A0A2M4B303_9DIPT